LSNFPRSSSWPAGASKTLSVRLGQPPPIPYREIILTARIMDEIFAQIYGSKEPKKEGVLLPV